MAEDAPNSESSPSSNASRPAITLTPRSKVKALMAALDHSDSETEQPNPTTEKGSGVPLVTNRQRSSQSDDEDDAPVQRPRGAMAARMLANKISEGPSKVDLLSKQNTYEMAKAQSTRSEDAAETANANIPHEATSPSQLVTEHAPCSASRSTETHSTSSPKSTTGNLSRARSPGLFVSPFKTARTNVVGRTAAADSDDSDDDLPSKPLQNKAFLALVARKRKEIKELENAEIEKRRASVAHDLSGSEDDNDEEGRRLTQQARPTRKASKKAIEEMNRETQRMSRNMQLAHQAKTKKTFTTADLLARLNRSSKVLDSEQTTTTDNSCASLQASSDVEGAKGDNTPLTSPQSGATPQQLGKFSAAATASAGLAAGTDSEDELPDVKEVLSQPVAQSPSTRAQVVKTRVSIGAITGQRDFQAEIDLDSDDDLQILPTKETRFPVFDRIPAKKAQQSTPLVTLRALANLNSPSKTKSKGSFMSSVQLQSLLHRRARMQAKLERQDRIEELRARGVIVETAEEREREQEETENMLEKAREQAEKLRKEERARAKKEGAGSANEDGLSASEDEDEDWEEGEDEEDDIELSGSEDELHGEDQQEEAEVMVAGEESMFDLAAVEAPDDGEDGLASLASSSCQAGDRGSHVDAPVSYNSSRPNRNRRVIIDEDDKDESRVDLPQSTPTTPVLNEVPDLGLGPPSSAPLGLTQMFAGTMADDSPSEGQYRQYPGLAAAPTSLDFLRDVPVASPPAYAGVLGDVSEDPLIYDSQPGPGDKQGGMVSESPASLTLTQAMPPPTQVSDMPDPTQDEGFASPRLEMGTQAHPTSTADTVGTILVQVPESPVAQRKGRLRRRRDAVAAFSDSDNAGDDYNAASSDEEEIAATTDAFRTMIKSSRKQIEQPAFDKKTSRAKEIVDEQAEESEDEYAGLGGASDDDSNADVDDEDAEMIDDDGNFKGDERKLAAFYANKERVDNERQVDKLYRDITSGALRRKRGADFDLSDSDDDEQERRRRKQREFARMRKALLEDEKIEKIAENPKKLAFLRAIEDRDSDSEVDVLDEPIDSTTAAQTQDSQETTGLMPGALKVKRTSSDHAVNDENRPPRPQTSKNPRRTPAQLARRPATLAEVRETLSFLVEDSFVPESHLSDSDHSDHDAHDHDSNVAGNPAPRLASSIAPLRNSTNTIVNRLSLARGAAGDTAGQSRKGMAFHAAPNVGSTGTFKMPAALLRRATTGGSTGSATDSTTSGEFKKPALRHMDSVNSACGIGAGSGSGGSSVRMGGSKKSNIHYQAREVERRAVVDMAERRRRNGVRKAALKGAKGSSVIGFLEREGSGFE